MKYPKSAYETLGNMVYLPRMLDKARLHLAGELPIDYHSRRGKNMDARICDYLRIAYADIFVLVEKGANDESIWEWITKHGRYLNAGDIELWNGFMKKRGSREDDPELTKLLQTFKQQSGLADRDDIQTFFEYFEADEGRS